MPAAAAIIAIGTVAASGITAGVSYATRPDDPKMPKQPKADPQVASRAAFAAQDRQRRRAAAAFGRSDTIVTGPLGLPGGGSSGGGRSLLGQ